MIVSVVVCEPFSVAVMVAEVEVTTGLVVIVKVAVVAPANTVTLAGTLAEALLSESVTTAPPAGAAPFKVTVPVEDVPPGTLVGFTDTAETPAGLTVSVAVRTTL